MQVDYAKDSALFNRVVSLIDEVFPGAKQMIAYGDALGAHWSKASIPFVVEKKGNIIAHLGIVPMTVSLPNKTHHIAALHGICVKKAYRRQGYFRLLMTEALAYIQENFDSSLLFTHDPHYYQGFGYQVVPQSDFAITVNHEGNQSSDLRRLYLEQPEDLALFRRIYASNETHSCFLPVQHEILFILNSQDMKLYYSHTLDAIIALKENKKLYIQAVIGTSALSFKEVLAQLPPKCHEVILQFYPSTDFVDLPYKLIPAKTDGHCMITANFPQPHVPFRWNEMARC